MDKLDELIKRRTEKKRLMQEDGDNSHEILAKLYGHRTHFITELLQNAEDEGASEVIFRLSETELEFSHNAPNLFTFEDIRAVSNFGDNKEKKEKPNAIGRFGIGFKSVYSITDAPRIISAEYDITIKELNIPTKTKEGNIGYYNGTKIILPFKQNERETTFDLLKKELEDFNLDYLLFLSSINTIKWEIGKTSGIYRRKYAKRDKRFITVSSENKEKKYCLLEKKVWVENKDLVVKIAFQHNKQGKFIPCETSPLFVFFPTKEETNLKFLVHAPFFTTPARENIQDESDLVKIEDDHRNEILREEIGKLLAESISIFKELNLLNINFLQILPINEEQCHRSIIYKKLYDSVKNELNSEKQLIPTNDNKFSTAKDALLLGSIELSELLNQKQSKNLFGRKFWVDKNITEDKTYELWKYLKRELSIPDVDLAAFASKIDAQFMSEQSDNWIIKFYSIVHKKAHALWRDGDKSKAGILRQKPIIRTEDNNHIAPFRENKKPNVYLPTKGNSQYTFVKRSIANDNEAKKFLKDLGLTEPDLFAEINEFVFPNLRKASTYPNYFSDLQKILEATQTENKEKRSRLLQDLKDCPFILSFNPESGETRHLKSNEVYFLTEELNKFFAGNSDVFFVAEEQYSFSKKQKQSWIELLKELGVVDYPRRIEIDANMTWQEKQQLRNNGSYTYENYCVSYELQGLDHFLKYKITKENSLVLWKLLIKCIENFPEFNKKLFFQGEYSYKYYSDHYKQFDAKFFKTLKETTWIFDNEDNQYKPSDIAYKNLPDEYKVYEEANTLSELLEFKQDEITKIEEMTGKKVVLMTEEEFKNWQKQQKGNTTTVDNEEEGFIPEYTPDEVTPIVSEYSGEEKIIDINEEQNGTGRTFGSSNGSDNDDEENEEPTHPSKPSQKILNGIGEWGQKIVYNELLKEFANDSNIEIEDRNKGGKKGKGCDFVVKNKQTGQIIRLVEVKSTTEPFGQPLTITGTQWEVARNKFKINDGDKYWIYCVFDVGKNPPVIKKIQNPIKLWREGKLFAHPINFIVQSNN